MFNLSRPCKLLCFIVSWTRVVVSVMLYPCILCVVLLVYLFVLCVACLTVLVNCLVKQFAIWLGVVAILLLNIMDACSVGGGSLLDRPCMAHPSVHLSVPSICLVYVFVCRKLSPYLRVLELDHRCLLSLCYFFV